MEQRWNKLAGLRPPATQGHRRASRLPSRYIPDCGRAINANERWRTQSDRLRRLAAKLGVPSQPSRNVSSMSLADGRNGATCSVVDPSLDETFARLFARLDRGAQISLLETLSYRERVVLELRYGLVGEQRRRAHEIGAMFNLAREQVRRIERAAIATILSACGRASPDEGLVDRLQTGSAQGRLPFPKVI
jgi:hypothetical protein